MWQELSDFTLLLHHCVIQDQEHDTRVWECERTDFTSAWPCERDHTRSLDVAVLHRNHGEEN